MSSLFVKGGIIMSWYRDNGFAEPSAQTKNKINTSSLSGYAKKWAEDFNNAQSNSNTNNTNTNIRNTSNSNPASNNNVNRNDPYNMRPREYGVDGLKYSDHIVVGTRGHMTTLQRPDGSRVLIPTQHFNETKGRRFQPTVTYRDSGGNVIPSYQNRDGVWTNDYYDYHSRIQDWDYTPEQKSFLRSISPSANDFSQRLGMPGVNWNSVQNIFPSTQPVTQPVTQPTNTHTNNYLNRSKGLLNLNTGIQQTNQTPNVTPQPIQNNLTDNKFNVNQEQALISNNSNINTNKFGGNVRYGGTANAINRRLAHDMWNNEK